MPITYFQPVLDKLNVAPSRLELGRPSVLVEGKGDYRIIEVIRRQLTEDQSAYSVVPTRGAAGMDELIGLFIGWAIPFVVCLDDDVEGKRSCLRYRAEWGLPDSQIFSLGDLHESLAGKQVEGLLSDAERETICEHYGVTKLKKGQIGLYFSEVLASGKPFDVSKETAERVIAFDQMVKAGLEQSSTLDPQPKPA